MRGFEYLANSAFSLALLVVLIFLPLAPVFASDLVEETPAEEQTENVPNDDSGTSESVDFETETNAEGNSESEVSMIESENLNQGITETEILTPPEENSSDLVSLSLQEVEAVPSTNAAGSDLSSTVGDTVVNSVEEIPDVLADEEILTVAEELEEVIQDDQILQDSTTTIPMSTSSVEIIEVPEVTPLASSTTEIEVIPLIVADVQTDDTVVPEILPDEEHVASLDTLTNDANIFSFSKQECVSVGDGSFYCTNGTTSPVSTGADRVFSAPDQDGDLEIYIERDGAVLQITSNQLDDNAPFYDELSNSIVWHRLVDARYQIISYDAETGAEEQITNDRYNNMEPARYGDISVWQGWVGNDWEVMLEEDGELRMLTDNTIEDIAPRINGNYIVWQAFENSAWRVKVYDLLTKQIETIADSDGASVNNPRFVLVYDTEHENGDVETKGYDLESGEVTPLTSTPSPTPKEIPDPEQTGEERALVSVSTQLKSKIDGEIDDEPLDPDVPVVEDGDLLVTPQVEQTLGSLGTSTTTESVDPGIADELIVDAYVDTTVGSSSIDHIEDVIVTPFVEPIEVSVDPTTIIP